MSDPVYERLADRLDAIPNGYPRTASGIELRVLEKLFTPEQAALALTMRLLAEPPERIARRAGLEPDHTRRMLEQMVADGLIRAEPGRNGPVYGLMPFVVGIYEMNVHRMDAELAALMEAFAVEVGPDNPIFRRPSIHRVIPVDETIPFDLKVHPYERAEAMLENAHAWGVRDCICRLQKRLIGQGCHHPLEVCITFSPQEGAFENSPGTRLITRQEALDRLKLAREAGLVHTTGNYRDGHNYICNCCTCSCGVLRGLVEFRVPWAVAHSDYHAAADPAICAGCEDCVDRCQFGAIAMESGAAVVDAARCVGCGQCVSICSTGAMALAPRPRKDREPLPSSLQTWMLRRGVRRIGPLLEVL
jgi:ferredoxin